MYIQLIHTEKSRYSNENILVQNFNSSLTSRQEINERFHACHQSRSTSRMEQQPFKVMSKLA
jgi:hypothetical protein